MNNIAAFPDFGRLETLLNSMHTWYSFDVLTFYHIIVLCILYYYYCCIFLVFLISVKHMDLCIASCFGNNNKYHTACVKFLDWIALYIFKYKSVSLKFQSKIYILINFARHSEEFFAVNPIILSVYRKTFSRGTFYYSSLYFS